MRHERGRRSAGFSLVEVVVAIAILGMAVIPVSGGLVLSHRLNARSEQILQARLAVSGAVETLMAQGIAVGEDGNPDVPEEITSGGSVTVALEEPDEYGAFPVTVTSTAEESVSVTTYIRPAPTPEETTEEGGGGG